ncbi:uncharacterized protein PHACADRAFT_214878 [Phanerochaete carnosa HHB-10118-sp]|uniref:Uncharacterized protein n=1 Tax=Phanerochaete carnosa (strain HHB-10118-sp) TaxID=650164 RepID=K5UFN6_PHACS|nr:uncharacterized protein PHACADRAFT_214878 [Phanerochaete carnosa HHB-10118-sp]EKM48266.1 hypothetical protein PHACADRAFT_214878 [Phanerochaete carnosa HHB-10118-sp]
MAPKRERDEALNEFSNRIFSSMLEELLMDVVLQSHQEIARSKSVCEICHTRCNAVHVPGPSNGSASGTTQPSPDSARPLDGSPAGTDTPTGNIYFDCSVCKRQVRALALKPTVADSSVDRVQSLRSTSKWLHGLRKLEERCSTECVQQSEIVRCRVTVCQLRSWLRFRREQVAIEEQVQVEG